MSSITLYVNATSSQLGALAIFHIYGGEADLHRRLDCKVGGKSNLLERNAMKIHELRYGWLRDVSSSVVDEVMLGKPAEGMRVLMTHGGTAIREAVQNCLDSLGFRRFEEANIGDNNFKNIDTILDTLLAGCVTEAQAAAVLESRMRRENGEAGAFPPDSLMQTHRVVVCGPPNAGKSSLLNELAGFERAFVDASAGATRDVVDELIDLGGYAVWLGDMPGFAGHDSGLAAEAWRRAVERLSLAEGVLFVCDASLRWEEGSDRAAREVASHLERAAKGGGLPWVLVVLNKSDLPSAIEGEPWREHFPDAASVTVCSLPGGNARAALEEAVCAMLESVM